MRIHRKDGAPLDPGALDGRAPAPKSAPAAILPDAPSKRGAPTKATPGRSSASFAAFAGGAFRRFAKPVAAVLLGASTLPALSGAALAQTTEIRLDAPTTIEAPHVDRLVSTATLPRETLDTSSALAPGPVTARGLFESYLADRLNDIAAQRAQFEAVAPTDVVRTDLLRLDEVVARFDDLIRRDGALPADLLADLDRVLDAIADARPGEFGAAIDVALGDLPSHSDPIAAPTASTNARLDGPGDGALRALLDASPVDFPDRAAEVLSRYRGIMTGADDALARLPDFAFTSRVPLFFDSGDGVLVVPPGARLVNDDGQLTIGARNLLWRQDGLTLVASEGAVRLGSELDGLQAGAIHASGDDWTASADGFVAGVRRDDGFGVIAAERLDLDLTNGTAHLEDARLVVGERGDAAITADVLRLDRDGFHLAVDDLAATQTRDGTHATAARLALADGATVVDGEAIDLRFGPDGADLSGARLTIANGDTRVDLTNANVTLRPLASGGHALAFTGDDVDVTSGTTALDLDAASGRVTLDADGQLRGLHLEGERVALTTADGTADLAGATVDARFDDSGALRRLTARGDALAFTGDDFAMNANGGRLDVALDAEGRLTRLTGQAADAAFTSDAGAFTGQGTALTAHFDEGALRTLEATTGAARWAGADGTTIAAADAGLNLAFAPDGHLAAATLAAGELDVATGAHQLAVSGLDVAVRFDDAGLLDEATARAGRLDYRGTDGTIVGAGDVALRVDATAGAIDRVVASAGQLDFTRGDEHLAITNGTLTVDAEGGRVTSAVATFDAATYEAGFGRLALAGTELALTYGDDGRTTLRGAAERLDLANDAGHLVLDGGTVEGTLAPDGTAEALRFAATHLAFEGTAEGDHPLRVDLADPTALLTQLEGGGQRLDITTGAGSFEVDGHRVALDGVEQITLATTPDGAIDTFTADFAGQLDFVQRGGDLAILTRDLEASYDRATSRLTLDFAEADVALRSEGLTAHVEGFAGSLDATTLRVHVDRAEVLRDLGEQLQVEVEQLTLDVTRSSTGALTALDVELGGLDANVQGIHALVRTPAGERVRLHIHTDDDGQVIKEAFLQIPEGGEVRIERDDLTVALGGQTLRFDTGDDGVYRLRGESLDVTASTRDIGVRVEGGDAQVSLDPSTGRLVIDEITGTRIDLSTPQGDLTVDIVALRDFMVRATRLEGGATGAALHLVPTTDGSTLTAHATGEVAGVPVELSFSNVHELEALGQISENQVHAFIRDPSGRGDIDLGFGPLELSGSAIEFIGRYHPYDPGRMTESVHQFVTLSGADVFGGVSFDPDGVLRLGTDRDGLNAELAVMLPRQYALPGYRFAMTADPSAAPGVIGSLGYRHEDLTFSVFAGVMPGSHATLHVKEGDISVGGVDLPKRTDLPTTGVAGLRFSDTDVDGGTLSVVGGGFVNPVGLTDTPYLNEPTPFGVLGGLEYAKDNWSVSAAGVVDLDRAGSVQGGGVMLRLGVKF